MKLRPVKKRKTITAKPNLNKKIFTYLMTLLAMKFPRRWILQHWAGGPMCRWTG